MNHRILRKSFLKHMLKIELVALILVLLGASTLSPSDTSRFGLYELLGVLLAASITTFGLRKMKYLTE